MNSPHKAKDRATFDPNLTHIIPTSHPPKKEEPARNQENLCSCCGFNQKNKITGEKKFYLNINNVDKLWL